MSEPEKDRPSWTEFLKYIEPCFGPPKKPYYFWTATLGWTRANADGTYSFLEEDGEFHP